MCSSSRNRSRWRRACQSPRRLRCHCRSAVLLMPGTTHCTSADTSAGVHTHRAAYLVARLTSLRRCDHRGRHALNPATLWPTSSAHLASCGLRVSRTGSSPLVPIAPRPSHCTQPFRVGRPPDLRRRSRRAGRDHSEDATLTIVALERRRRERASIRRDHGCFSLASFASRWVSRWRKPICLRDHAGILGTSPFSPRLTPPETVP